MADVLYTTTARIRAAIGVTELEIEDAQIVDLGVPDQLLFSLEGVYPEHVALAAAQPGTPEETRLFKALSLYCQYEAAVIVLMAGQNLLAQKITDGDVEVQRFDKDDLQKTLVHIMNMRDRYRTILTSTGTAPGVTMATLAHFSTVTPAYDPVTNTGSEI